MLSTMPPKSYSAVARTYPPIPRANFPFLSINRKRGACGSWMYLNCDSFMIRTISSPALSMVTMTMPLDASSSIITFSCALAIDGTSPIAHNRNITLKIVFIIKLGFGECPLNNLNEKRLSGKSKIQARFRFRESFCEINLAGGGMFLIFVLCP